MRHGRGARVPSVLAGLLILVVVGLLGSGCAPPTPPPSLSVELRDGASDVPLDSPLTITASGAVLDQVTLERLDGGGPAPEFALAETSARLAGSLAPDARYRLVARAHALSTAARPPWEDAARTDIVQERVFSTVPAPKLVGATEPLTVNKGEPLTLRFSQPLARAATAAPAPLQAQATIDPGDPRVLRVQVDQVAPGQQFALALRDLVGRNGAPAPEQTLAVVAPPAPELVSVNGGPVDDRVAVPLASSIALEWSEPVRLLQYRVADRTETWSGAPTQRVELPLAMAQGETRTLAIEDARTDDGGWLPAPRTIELYAPAPLRLAAVWPSAGAKDVQPDADPTFRFSEPIADRKAAEAAIRLEPPVAGRFEWLSPERVRFVPEEGFPSQSDVSVHVEGGPRGVLGASGSYMTESVDLGFRTGKRKVIDVSLGKQVMTLLEDGEAVWSAPVATGVRGAETPRGTYRVEYKMPVARFRGTNPGGSRYDIPDVKWVLAFYGDYTIHGAYWRQRFGAPASNGCISLTDANAKFVYDWAPEGTLVQVRS